MVEAVKIVVVVELDNDLARMALRTGIHGNARAEDALQFVNGGACVGVEADVLEFRSMAASVRGEALDLPHGKISASGPSRGFRAQRRVLDGEKSARVPRAQAPVFDHFADGSVQPQQAKSVGNGNAFFAGTFGGFLLREVKFLNQTIEGLRLFDGIQVFALEIFDKRDFHGFVVGNVLNDHGHAMHGYELRGAPPALAGQELKTRTAPANHERLDDSRAANRLRQLVERGLGEARARLVRTRIDQIDINLQAGTGGLSGARGCNGCCPGGR